MMFRSNCFTLKTLNRFCLSICLKLDYSLHRNTLEANKKASPALRLFLKDFLTIPEKAS